MTFAQFFKCRNLGTTSCIFSVITTPITKESVLLNRHGITIHTVKTRPPSCIPQDTLPVVLMHGLIGGSANYAMNIDELAQNRQVFAIDLLGFGQSSRFEFASDASEVERQYVQSLEEWRQKMRLDRFILLGHSMGGYLACAYAFKYPQRLAHLILNDPWGFPESSKFVQKVGPLLMITNMSYLRGPRMIRE